MAVAPGSTFGEAAAGMVRVSLAAPRDLPLDGLARLADEVADTPDDAWTRTAAVPVGT
ncbi:hypothetical protein [Cellulomonas wangsupingiae]|uniref:hypothetical protein n=1 Tax=Cellulomonas wangsupingiae TaxID=2968085 RepID=UPI001D0DE16A|nr:hypothetical protein [Cellulomonas wangsupingiae]MCM0641347.1 hypothetical protein [Cellulomonas wangsupingiae]